MAAISKSSLRKKPERSRSRQLLYLIVCCVICIVVFGDLFAATASVGEKESLLPTVGDVQAKKEGEGSNGSLRLGDTGKRIPTAGQDESPQEGVNNNQANDNNHYAIFHHYLKGQSGSVIQDMLMCHAYAYHGNDTYGGSCGEPTSLHPIHQSLIESIGVQNELRFACPRDHDSDTTTRIKTVPRTNYRQDDTRVWTPEYVEHLKNLVKYPPKVPDKFTIAVHIRRADVTPCKGLKEGYNRYLPNSHYQYLIDKYMQPDARVVIFSQNKSTEPFDDFRSKGYEVHLDGEVTDVWKAIAVSDVVILSRSSFSLVPAVVAKGTVVYTPFWHRPLKFWHVVDKEVLNKSNIEVDRLKLNCPTKNKFGGKMGGAKRTDRWGNPK